MQYLGDFVSGSTIRGSFNTRTAAGVPITLGGSPVLSVYKDGGTTETTIGVTLTVDFDSRTGHHLFAVVTSDGFYSTGSDYRVVITTGTVDGTSVVGTEVGSFSIQNRVTAPTAEANATAVRSELTTELGRIDAAVSSRLASASYTAPPSAASNATAVRSELTTELGRIDAAISSRLAAASYTTPPSSATIVTDVWAAATRTITGGTITTVSDKTGYSLATTPPTASAIASQVRTELTTELGRIDAAISTRSTFAGGAVASVTAPVTVGTNNDKTGYALSQAFPANFASLGINASGHVSRVVLVDTCTTNSDMRGTNNALLAASYTAPDNASITAIKAKTDNLPSDPADASDIATSFGTVNTKLDAIDDFIDTEIAAIKSVTDKLDTALALDGSVYQFTVNALENAPSGGGGGGLDAEGVRSAIGLASANLDTQLTNLKNLTTTIIGL